MVGSTNFDNRPFGLNNEVNLIQRDSELVAQLGHVIAGYLAQSRKISLAEWSNRSLIERGLTWVGSVLEWQE